MVWGLRFRPQSPKTPKPQTLDLKILKPSHSKKKGFGGLGGVSYLATLKTPPTPQVMKGLGFLSYGFLGFWGFGVWEFGDLGFLGFRVSRVWGLLQPKGVKSKTPKHTTQTGEPPPSPPTSCPPCSSSLEESASASQRTLRGSQPVRPEAGGGRDQGLWGFRVR